MRAAWLLVLAVACFLPGCQSEQAHRTSENITLSVANYQANVTDIVEAFISSYRIQAKAKADELYQEAWDSAMAQAGDGKIDAAAARSIENTRLRQYAAIEQTEINMRAKFAKANLDAANAVRYSEALQQYFSKQAVTNDTLMRSSEQVIAMLEALINKAAK